MYINCEINNVILLFLYLSFFFETLYVKKQYIWASAIYKHRCPVYFNKRYEILVTGFFSIDINAI